MNSYVLEIAGVDNEADLAAARWELFVCPEVRGLRLAAPVGVEILYDDEPQVTEWLGVLGHAGYTVTSSVAA